MTKEKDFFDVNSSTKTIVGEAGKFKAPRARMQSSSRNAPTNREDALKTDEEKKKILQRVEEIWLVLLSLLTSDKSQE